MADRDQARPDARRWQPHTREAVWRWIRRTNEETRQTLEALLAKYDQRGATR